MAQSLYPQQLTLSQCLDNLRSASLLVLQHEQVSDEAKSFLGELIQTILHRAEECDTTRTHSSRETETSLAPHHQISGQGPEGAPTSPYQFEVDSATGEILVANLSTGKTLTCSADDLINRAGFLPNDNSWVSPKE